MNKERDENTKYYLFKEKLLTFSVPSKLYCYYNKKSSSVNASSEVFINLIITLVWGLNFTILKF